MKIKRQSDLAKYLGTENIKRSIYKYTNCGAWITLKEKSLEIGSIVEGVEWGTATHYLTYPFSSDEFENVVKNVEYEAKEIWNETHGCNECPENPENGYRFIDPECKSCKGEGVIL